MNTNPAKEKINNLISVFVSVVTLFLPWFFLSTTYEYFEFNKLYLFVAAVSAMLVAWAVKMILQKQVGISKSTMDLPLLLIITSYGLSTLTSLDRNSSLFGSYGRWFPGLFSFVALYIFYYVVATNVSSVKKIKYITWSVIAGSAIASILGLINYFGIVIPFGGLINRPGFLLTGTSSVAAAISFIGGAVASAMLVSVRTGYRKGLASAVFIINFIATIVFGGLLFGIAELVIASVVLLKSKEEDVTASKLYLFPTIGALAMIMVMFFLIPQTKNVLQRDYPKEIVPSFQESWIVASTTLRDFPVFGTGASTFYLNYPRYRTIDQNYTNTWNVRFDKPANELLNVISTLGIFGAIAYGVFITMAIKTCIKSIKVNDAYRSFSMVLSAGLIASILLTALTYASFQSSFFIFLFAALLNAEATINTNKGWAKIATVSLASMDDQQIIYRKEILHYIAAVPMFVIAVLGVYIAFRQYLPEYYIRKAVNYSAAQNVEMSYDYLSKAIEANPYRSEYHRLYANTNIAIAQSILSGSEVSDQQKQAAQNLLSQAIRNIKFMTETLNPLDPANWEARAEALALLIPVTTDGDQMAIQAYNTAIQLDPTNPMLRVGLGQIYYGKNDYLSAGNLFKQAVNLKNDYANARYNLGYALYQLKAYNEAKAEFETAKSLVSQDSEDYKRVVQDLELIDAMIAQAADTQAETKPSIEAIEKVTAETTTPTVQEPLVKPGETVSQ